jgi:hypothetical protein
MTPLWDDIKKTVKDGYITAAGKTGEFTRIGKIKLEIIGVQREIGKKFSELGGLTYHLLNEEKDTAVAGHRQVLSLVDGVRKLEAALHEKEKMIERIKSEEKEKLNSRKAAL